MKKGLSAILTGAFLLLALLMLGAFNLSKPRILVLHSAGVDSAAAKRMDQGIRHILEKNRQPLSVRWHYLDINSLPDEDHREDAAKSGRRAVEQFDPDFLIAVDDEAQQYVARRYAGQSRPRVVYTAIDQEPQSYGYAGAANVTGISEVLPLAAIRDALLLARKGQPARLAVLGTSSPTGKGQLKQVQAFDWAPHTVQQLQSLDDFAAWQAAIKAMDGKADALLVLSHEGLRMGATPTEPHAGNSSAATHEAEIVQWIEKNAKPLPIGISTGYVERGGGLSIAPSATAMGEAAATTTLQWLKAKPASPAPPASQGSHYSVGIRASALQARKVELPSIYLEAARLEQLYFP